MIISKKNWLCKQCSLQFDCKNIYNTHLNLLHKQIIETKSVENERKTIETRYNFFRVYHLRFEKLVDAVKGLISQK